MNKLLLTYRKQIIIGAIIIAGIIGLSLSLRSVKGRIAERKRNRKIADLLEGNDKANQVIAEQLDVPTIRVEALRQIAYNCMYAMGTQPNEFNGNWLLNPFGFVEEVVELAATFTEDEEEVVRQLNLCEKEAEMVYVAELYREMTNGRILRGDILDYLTGPQRAKISYFTAL